MRPVALPRFRIKPKSSRLQQFSISAITCTILLNVICKFMYHVGTRDVRFLRDTRRYKYSLHYLYRYIVHSEICLIYAYQLIHLYIYILFKKFIIYIKTLKTLLHVSILRSSSESTYCSLLKLYIKTISDLLRYITFGDVAACCHITKVNVMK